jgi:hypothetical protein
VSATASLPKASFAVWISTAGDFNVTELASKIRNGFIAYSFICATLSVSAVWFEMAEEVSAGVGEPKKAAGASWLYRGRDCC